MQGLAIEPVEVLLDGEPAVPRDEYAMRVGQIALEHGLNQVGDRTRVDAHFGR